MDDSIPAARRTHPGAADTMSARNGGPRAHLPVSCLIIRLDVSAKHRARTDLEPIGPIMPRDPNRGWRSDVLTPLSIGGPTETSSLELESWERQGAEESGRAD
jgi:hypothetical protein